MSSLPPLKKISETCWEVSTSFKPGMRVPARIFATERLLREMDEGVFQQITNVAALPGIQKYALALPDAHRGYGYPIGGVAAFDPEEGGVISPGGIGFDINCGMRMVATSLTEKDLRPRLSPLVERIFSDVPSGVGSRGAVKLSKAEFKKVIEEGAAFCIRRGLGWKEDLGRVEDGGRLTSADPQFVSEKALKRGIDQLGTLGSGNHYLEIEVVEKIFDKETAKKLGVFKKGQVVVAIHSGSRGFGHQVATDYLRLFLQEAMPKYKLKVLDRELACAPFRSPEGQAYFAAAACAANNAFANRQALTHLVRGSFEKIFGKSAESLGMHLIYDVAHNIAKVEKYEGRELLVHRKGATRSFGPGSAALPLVYRNLGQPVLLGGSMESGSYLLLGTKEAEEYTFGSTAHGSGRTMSRAEAKRKVWGEKLQGQLRERGIVVRTTSYSGLAEEAGFAYKEISEVVKAISKASLSVPVASFKPIGNIKG